MQRITIRISQRDKDFLSNLATQKDLTVSEIMRDAIQAYKTSKKLEQEKKDLIVIKEACLKTLQAQAFVLENSIKSRMLSIELFNHIAAGRDISSILTPLMAKAADVFEQYKSKIDSNIEVKND